MRLITVLVSILLLAGVAVADEPGVYDLTVSGKSCELDTYENLNCEYRVGEDLHFSILRIGNHDSEVVFRHLDPDGDFLATFGDSNSCLVVAVGKKFDNYETLREWVLSGRTKAFVSTMSGRVYKHLYECREGY